MPEMISYVVEQTREVKVTANSLEGAILIAQQQFEMRQSPEVDGEVVKVWGHSSSNVRQTNITARESY